MPSVSEAVALAKNFDVPGVSGIDVIWTDDESYNSGTPVASVVGVGGVHGFAVESAPVKTVCVTNPSA